MRDTYYIRNLTFSFNGADKLFFLTTNLELQEGSVYCVVGKNGVGKSTLFSILQGATQATSFLTGSVVYKDQEYYMTDNMFPYEISSLVKTVIQDSNKMIVPSMTVEENLQLAQMPHYPSLVPLAYATTIPNIITECAIDLTKRAQLLSGGQKQILAIVMTLQKSTQILLLDEPTASLDEYNTKIVTEFLIALAQKLNLVIIIISHDKDVIDAIKPGHIITIEKNYDGQRLITQK